jgi:hypothetical protein
MTLDSNVRNQIIEFLSSIFSNYTGYQTLVRNALYGTTFLRHIRFNGNAFDDATQLVDTLNTLGGKSAIRNLLENLSKEFGFEQQKKISDFIAELQDDAEETRPMPIAGLGNTVSENSGVDEPPKPDSVKDKAEEKPHEVKKPVSEESPSPINEDTDVKTGDEKSKINVPIIVALIGVVGVIVGGLITNYGMIALEEWRLNRQLTHEAQTATALHHLVDIAQTEAAESATAIWNNVLSQTVSPSPTLVSTTETATSTPSEIPTTAPCTAQLTVTPIFALSNSDNRYPVATLVNLIGQGDCPFDVRASRFSANGISFGEDSGLKEQAEQIAVAAGETEICFHITYGAWEVGATACVDVFGYEITATAVPPSATFALTNTPTPSNTPMDTLTPIAFSNGNQLQFFYNATSFYMRNDSNGIVGISRINFQGFDTNGNAVSSVFLGSGWVSGYAFVEGNGRCAAIEMVDRLGHLEPDECGATSIGGTFNAFITPQSVSRDIFWTGRNITQFAVYWDTVEIARCPIPDYTQENGFCEVRVGD